MRKILLILFCLSCMAGADPLRAFYDDYVKAFRKAGGNPTHYQRVEFLQAHRELVDPSLWADWIKAEQFLGGGKYGRLIIEFDTVTGSAGNQLSDFRYGKATPKGVPVTFKTTDMRDSPVSLKLLVSLRNGRISDTQYNGGYDTLREALKRVLDEANSPTP